MTVQKSCHLASVFTADKNARRFGPKDWTSNGLGTKFESGRAMTIPGLAILKGFFLPWKLPWAEPRFDGPGQLRLAGHKLVICYDAFPCVFVGRKSGIQGWRFYVVRPPFFLLWIPVHVCHRTSLSDFWGLLIPLTCSPWAFYGAVLGISLRRGVFLFATDETEEYPLVI